MPTDSIPHRPAEQGLYVFLQETPDGNLQVMLNDRGRQDFGEIETVHSRYGARAALITLIADHLQNGWELVPPEDLGALTAAPILSREIERNLFGQVVTAGRVYWFPEYAVLDEIEELRRTGNLEFRGTE